MAKIYEEVIVIKLSKLVKTDAISFDEIATEDVVTALASVVEELTGEGVIVEVEKA
jgi:hypothetical protein